MVSFSPWRPRATEMATSGGLALIPVKNENGEMFATPASDMVATRAMGRGTMAEIMS